MAENGDRKELKRRLEQARRMAQSVADAITQERLQNLIRDLEKQLG